MECVIDFTVLHTIVGVQSWGFQDRVETSLSEVRAMCQLGIGRSRKYSDRRSQSAKEPGTNMSQGNVATKLKETMRSVMGTKTVTSPRVATFLKKSL